MRLKHFLIVFYVGSSFYVIFYTFFKIKTPKEHPVNLSSVSTYNNLTPPSLVMYELIEKYSTEYNIPKYVAYNVAYKETTYMGPFHWGYNPYRESQVGAVGPMQLMVNTCNWINKSHYTKKIIKTDLELNVKSSMMLLNILYKKYKNWSVVCGWYNTGKPIINDYGNYCGTNFNYQSKWLKLKNPSL